MAPFNPQPESLAKREKREKAWESERASEAKAKEAAEKRKKADIYKRAEQHLAEFKAQVSGPDLSQMHH